MRSMRSRAGRARRRCVCPEWVRRARRPRASVPAPHSGHTRGRARAPALAARPARKATTAMVERPAAPPSECAGAAQRRSPLRAPLRAPSTGCSESRACSAFRTSCGGRDLFHFVSLCGMWQCEHS